MNVIERIDDNVETPQRWWLHLVQVCLMFFLFFSLDFFTLFQWSSTIIARNSHFLFFLLFFATDMQTQQFGHNLASLFFLFSTFSYFFIRIFPISQLLNHHLPSFSTFNSFIWVQILSLFFILNWTNWCVQQFVLIVWVQRIEIVIEQLILSYIFRHFGHNVKNRFLVEHYCSYS